MQVDNVQISTAGPAKPELAIDDLALPRMITAGQPFEVKTTVRNLGWKALFPARYALRHGVSGHSDGVVDWIRLEPHLPQQANR